MAWPTDIYNLGNFPRTLARGLSSPTFAAPP
jgi:hypothetical protein